MFQLWNSCAQGLELISSQCAPPKSSVHTPSENQNQSNYSFCIHVYLLSLWESMWAFTKRRVLYFQLRLIKSQKMVLGVCVDSVYPKSQMSGLMLVSVFNTNLEWNLVNLLAFVGHQLQTASTESFFLTFGHGSPPNISGSTVTEHEFSPMQVCKNIMYY